MAANIDFWDLGSGYLNPGKSVTWWWNPDTWGELPLITVQPLVGTHTEKQIEVTRIVHRGNADDSREGRVTVSNTGSNYCYYRIRFVFFNEP